MVVQWDHRGVERNGMELWLDQQIFCHVVNLHSGLASKYLCLKISNCKQVVICTMEELTVFSTRWSRKPHEEDNYLWWFLSGSPQACTEITEQLFPWAVTPQGLVLLGLHTLSMSLCVDFLISAKENLRCSFSAVAFLLIFCSKRGRFVARFGWDSHKSQTSWGKDKLTDGCHRFCVYV